VTHVPDEVVVVPCTDPHHEQLLAVRQLTDADSGTLKHGGA
jgi:hypothetical protein